MIEHYDYYLRRRKFHVITDHSALKAMKTKESFGRIKWEKDYNNTILRLNTAQEKN